MVVEESRRKSWVRAAGGEGDEGMKFCGEVGEAGRERSGGVR